MRDADFYEWQRRASRHGTLWRALTHYYADSDHLYRITVNGTTHRLPVLTTASWLRPRPDVDSVFGDHDPEAGVIDSDADAVQARVNRIAYWNDDLDADDPAIEDYLWNADIVQPLPARETPRIDTGETTYFSSLTQDERLVSELLDRLYAQDIPADASDAQLAAALDSLTLSERETVAPAFDPLVDQLSSGTVAAPFGVNVAAVFNTGDDYRLVLSKRSENVAVYPAMWSLVPAGGIETDSEGRPSATWTALCEFGEELFAIPESDSVTDHQAVQHLQRLLETDRAHLDFTGITIAARRLGVNITALLFIDDPDYYQQHIADGFEFNWETTDGQEVSLSDAAALDEALDPNHCVPAHVTCAYEGLLRLADAYGVEVAIDLDRHSLAD